MNSGDWNIVSMMGQMSVLRGWETFSQVPPKMSFFNQTAIDQETTDQALPPDPSPTGC
jgi:hypothetical protein